MLHACCWQRAPTPSSAIVFTTGAVCTMLLNLAGQAAVQSCSLTPPSVGTPISCSEVLKSVPEMDTCASKSLCQNPPVQNQGLLVCCTCVCSPLEFQLFCEALSFEPELAMQTNLHEDFCSQAKVWVQGNSVNLRGKKLVISQISVEPSACSLLMSAHHYQAISDYLQCSFCSMPP